MTGTNVTVPVPRAPDRLAKAISEKVDSGYYILGDKIAPKKFLIASIDENGTFLYILFIAVRKLFIRYM